MYELIHKKFPALATLLAGVRYKKLRLPNSNESIETGKVPPE